MAEQKRRGYASPLQKAQAGKIGGGPVKSTTVTEQRAPAPEPEPAQETTKKAKREDTHFRQTVWMPIPLNRRLKVHAAKIDEDISGIINKLVESYLDNEED